MKRAADQSMDELNNEEMDLKEKNPRLNEKGKASPSLSSKMMKVPADQSIEEINNDTLGSKEKSHRLNGEGKAPPHSNVPSTSNNSHLSNENNIQENSNSKETVQPQPVQSLMASTSYAPMSSSLVETGPVPVIQNIIATVYCGCLFDLRKINFYTRNSEYNPSRFSGIVMRLRDPRATALVFSSGKIVVTGTKHESHALLATKKFARIIQKLGFPVKFQNFKIHNIVSTCDLKFPIHLESLYGVHGQFTSYEPELFPALIYRMVKPRVVILIFVNGKVVITGAKSREETNVALDSIHRVLKSFRKQ